MQTESKFWIRLFFFSLAVGVLFYTITPILPERIRFGSFWAIQLVMILITIAFHLGLMRAGRAGDQAFVRFFMGATGLKMLVFMVLLIGYSMLNKATAVPFIVNFFLFYLLYTVFEVSLVYKKFSSNRGTPTR